MCIIHLGPKFVFLSVGSKLAEMGRSSCLELCRAPREQDPSMTIWIMGLFQLTMSSLSFPETEGAETEDPRLFACDNILKIHHISALLQPQACRKL